MNKPLTSTPISSNPPKQSGFSLVIHSLAFDILWFSEMISLVGDRILMVALINLVYDLSGSAAAVGLLSVVKAFPALCLGAFAGLLADRWSRKWIMVISNLLLCGMVLLIPSISHLYNLFAVYFVMSIISQFFIPARSAAIPSLVPLPALGVANSLFAMAFVGAIAIGPAIGGWIIERAGNQTAFFVDAFTFLIPALAVSFLNIPQRQSNQKNQNLAADWKEGFTEIQANPILRNAIWLIGAAALLIASISSLGVMIVREKLAGGAGDFGWMMSITGAGMLIGAFVNTPLSRHSKRQTLSIMGAFLAGIAIICLSVAFNLSLVMASAFLLGLGFVTVQINSQTTLQMSPEHLRGRILGLSQAVMGSVTFLAAGLAGILASRWGASIILTGAGIFTIVITLYIAIVSKKQHPH